MNPTVAKLFVKIVVGIAGSALLGTIYKGEKEIQSMINAHYAKPEDNTDS